MILTGWQPIETAPKDGTELILARGERVTVGAWVEWKEEAPEYTAHGVYLGNFEQDSGADWFSWDGGFSEDEPPTHWMPLPQPPVK